MPKNSRDARIGRKSNNEIDVNNSREASNSRYASNSRNANLLQQGLDVEQ